MIIWVVILRILLTLKSTIALALQVHVHSGHPRKSRPGLWHRTVHGVRTLRILTGRVVQSGNFLCTKRAMHAMVSDTLLCLVCYSGRPLSVKGYDFGFSSGHPTALTRISQYKMNRWGNLVYCYKHTHIHIYIYYLFRCDYSAKIWALLGSRMFLPYWFINAFSHQSLKAIADPPGTAWGVRMGMSSTLHRSLAIGRLSHGWAGPQWLLLSAWLLRLGGGGWMGRG